MRVAAGTKDEQASTESVIDIKPTKLTVPIRDDLTTVQTIACGLRQDMLSMDGKDVHGGVSSGAGLGSDWIVLEWGDRRAVLRGSEVLKAWVATFDPEAVKHFPKEVN